MEDLLKKILEKGERGKAAEVPPLPKRLHRVYLGPTDGAYAESFFRKLRILRRWKKAGGGFRLPEIKLPQFSLPSLPSPLPPPPPKEKPSLAILSVSPLEKQRQEMVEKAAVGRVARALSTWPGPSPSLLEMKEKIDMALPEERPKLEEFYTEEENKEKFRHALDVLSQIHATELNDLLQSCEVLYRKYREAGEKDAFEKVRSFAERELSVIAAQHVADLKLLGEKLSQDVSPLLKDLSKRYEEEISRGLVELKRSSEVK